MLAISLPTLNEACRQLISEALAAGGPDNISVGVFALGEDPPPKAEAHVTRPLPNGRG